MRKTRWTKSPLSEVWHLIHKKTNSVLAEITVSGARVFTCVVRPNTNEGIRAVQASCTTLKSGKQFCEDVAKLYRREIADK